MKDEDVIQALLDRAASIRRGFDDSVPRDRLNPPAAPNKPARVKRVPKCHPDQPYHALGLCPSCYQKHRWRSYATYRRRLQRRRVTPRSA